ncbi:Serine/threonine-protein kinase PknB [Rubripirellula amarantea]|uniref:non-specific serine/threonine protein kinase n=1 Tax=Rubripirellula amarantea TaxID=2527999 RepID=A0A5C5WRF5_9BACT|nr:serine/threonine-protein kinase [Rubripirellula amarantea]TWT53040.1 Serine/threonine-protein kinase PknB [Rubripirellula amarantea]
MPQSPHKPWHNSDSLISEPWLTELIQSYEKDWQRVIESSASEAKIETPSFDALLQRLEQHEIDENKRTLAKSTLRLIDQYYRETLDTKISDDNRDDNNSRNSSYEEPTIDSFSPADANSAQEVTLDTGAIDRDVAVESRSENEVTIAGKSAPSGELPVRVHPGSGSANTPVEGMDDTADFSVGEARAIGTAKVGRSNIRPSAKGRSNFNALPPGESIGDYEIKSVLGQGGMGVVYLANQKSLDRLVALKMILDGSRVNQAMLDRFDAEAKAIAKLQHENIVRIYEVGEHDDHPYFSLEFIKGATLGDLIRSNPMTPSEAARVLESVARGLQYAHEQNIIHRDIKPANILLTSDGTPKISDFGLAREIERDQSLSITGAVVGTPGYMAPEQARAATDIGPAADIWGMGAMLYAMLTGRAPFVGSNPGESVMMLLREEPVPPSRLRIKIPKDLETICLKCLEKDPSRRYIDARHLADDLAKFQRGEPISARPISLWERLIRWCKRNPTIAVPSGLAACLALALAVGGPLAAGTIYQQKTEVEKSNKALEVSNNKLVVSEEEERKARQLAEQNEQLAEQNAERARASEAVAVKAKETAQRNAESAQAGYKQAVDALKSLVFGVLRKLDDRPGMSDVREELLNTAREGLARLDSTASDPTQNNIIAAGTLRRLGDANLETGRVEAARQCYARCLDVVASLDKENKLPGRFHNLSTAHDLLGQSLRALGKMNEAKSQFETALTLRRQWLNQEPSNQGVRQNIAATLGRLAYVDMDLGNLDAAQEWFEESAQIREDSAKDDHFSIGAQLEWIGAKWSLEKLRVRNGDLKAATGNLTKIAKDLNKISDENPFMVAPAWNAGLMQADLATWNLYLGNHAIALQFANDSATRLQKLKKQEKKNLKLSESLAESLHLKAICIKLHSTEASDELDATAQHALREAVSLRQEILEADPSLGLIQLRLANDLAQLGETDQAKKILEQIEIPSHAHSSWWQAFAVANAQLATALKTDPAYSGNSDGLIKQQNYFSERAVSAIKAGMAENQIPSAFVKLAPEITSLRELPIWDELVDSP